MVFVPGVSVNAFVSCCVPGAAASGAVVHAPFPAPPGPSVPPAGLCRHGRLIQCPEDLANATALIREGDLDVDLRLRHRGVRGRGEEGHQRRAGVTGGRRTGAGGVAGSGGATERQMHGERRGGRGDPVVLVIGDHGDGIGAGRQRQTLGIAE